jgi:hypothetical protein
MPKPACHDSLILSFTIAGMTDVCQPAFYHWDGGLLSYLHGLALNYNLDLSPLSSLRWQVLTTALSCCLRWSFLNFFAWSDLKPQSSLSQPPKKLGWQVWVPCPDFYFFFEPVILVKLWNAVRMEPPHLKKF